MSIQTTRIIGRVQAEIRLADKKAEEAKELWLRFSKGLTDSEIEDELEGTFDNFRIED